MKGQKTVLHLSQQLQVLKQSKAKAKSQLKQSSAKIITVYLAYFGIIVGLIFLLAWRIYSHLTIPTIISNSILIWLILTFLVAGINIISLNLVTAKRHMKNIRPLSKILNIFVITNELKIIIAKKVHLAGADFIYTTGTGILTCILFLITSTSHTTTAVITICMSVIWYICHESKKCGYSQAIYITYEGLVKRDPDFNKHTLKKSQQLMNHKVLAYWLFRISFLLYLLPSGIILGLGLWKDNSILILIGLIITAVIGMYTWIYMQLAEADYYQRIAQAKDLNQINHEQTVNEYYDLPKLNTNITDIGSTKQTNKSKQYQNNQKADKENSQPQQKAQPADEYYSN